MSGRYDDDDGGQLWRGPDGAHDAARTQPGAFDPLRPALGAGQDFDPFRPGGTSRDTAAAYGMAWVSGEMAPARGVSSAASGGGSGPRRGPWFADMEAFFAEPAAGAAGGASNGATAGAGRAVDNEADPLRPVPAHVQQATQARIDALAAGAVAAPRGPAPVLAFKPMHDATRGASPTGPAGAAGPAGLAGGVAASADAQPVRTGAEPLRAAVVHANGAPGLARHGASTVGPKTAHASAGPMPAAVAPLPTMHGRLSFEHALGEGAAKLTFGVSLQQREAKTAAWEQELNKRVKVKAGDFKVVLSKKGAALANAVAGLDAKVGLTKAQAQVIGAEEVTFSVKLGAFEAKQPFDFSLLSLSIEGKGKDVHWFDDVLGPWARETQVDVTVKGSLALTKKLLEALQKELQPLVKAAQQAEELAAELAQAEVKKAELEARLAQATEAEAQQAAAQREARVAAKAARRAEQAALAAEQRAAPAARAAARSERVAATTARQAADRRLRDAWLARRGAAEVLAAEEVVLTRQARVVSALAEKSRHVGFALKNVAGGLKTTLAKQIGKALGKAATEKLARGLMQLSRFGLKAVPWVGWALVAKDCVDVVNWLRKLPWEGGRHFGADGEGAGEGGGGIVVGQGAGAGAHVRPATAGGVDADGGDVDRGVAGTGTTGVDDTGVAAPAAGVSAAPQVTPTPRDANAPATPASTTPTPATPAPAATTTAAPAAGPREPARQPATSAGTSSPHGNDASHATAGKAKVGGAGSGTGGGSGGGAGGGVSGSASHDDKPGASGAGAGAVPVPAVGGPSAPRAVPGATLDVTPVAPAASAQKDATPTPKSATPAATADGAPTAKDVTPATPAVAGKAAADVAGADVDGAAGADVDGAGAAGQQASHTTKAPTLKPGAAASDAAQVVDKASAAHQPSAKKPGKSQRPAPARRPPTAAAIRDRRLFWGLHEDVVQVVQWRGGQLRVNQETLRAFRAMLQDGPRLSSTGAHVMLRDLKVTIGRPMGAQIPFEITYVAEARYEGGAWSPKAQDAQSLLFDVPTQRAHEVGSWHAVLFDDDAREGPALQVKNGTVVRRRREVDVPGVGVFGIVEDPKLKDGGDHYDVTVMLKPLVIEDRTATVPLNGEMVKLVDPRVKTQGFNVLLKHNK